MKRKTFDVADFKKTVNQVLFRSICAPEIREGWINALECVLHDSGNYKGYNYLNANDVPPGEKPGIRGENPVSKFIDTDSTRRVYI